MFDNRVFDVNGPLDDGGTYLEKALELAFLLHGAKTEVVAWRFSHTHGLILDWTDSADGANLLPASMNAKEVMSLVGPWLHTEKAKSVELGDWERDADHDGSNGPGFRVYCGSWGHVEGWQAICAVKRVFVWYGK